MRVLIWISSGMLEDLARAATKNEDSFELVGVFTDTEEVIQLIQAGRVDILLLGQGRLPAWSEAWRSGAFDEAAPFCPMLVSTLPVSTATLLAAREVGIVELVDLTMDRDVMGHRMVAQYRELGGASPRPAELDDRAIDGHQILRDITNETDRRILALIAEGKFDKEIADEMFLSLQTIRNRISRILTETGARNRTHLAILFTSGMNGVHHTNAAKNIDHVA